MGRHRLLLAGEPVFSLADYEATGGGEALRSASASRPEATVDTLEASGLRGRGGAGFPTATKWRSIMAGGRAAGDRFVVVNGAEGEPGTFKDRALLRHNPYLLVEGLLISARTVGAAQAYVALKGSFTIEAERVIAAIAEIDEAGWAPDVTITLVQGPDEYLFGEEKALLEVIEGEDPLPRLFPPYIYGLFSTSPQMGWSAGQTLEARDDQGANPTLVNNVETLSTVPLILRNGAAWYRSIGTTESPGTIICTVSGDTIRHGVDEFEMGTPVSEIIAELGGGLPDGRSIRYVLGGVSNPVLHVGQIDTPATYEDLAAAGTGLGTGGFIVFDDRTSAVELAGAVSRFLWIESCGQCPACKLGTGDVTRQLEGTSIDLAALSSRLATVADAARCYLPTQAQRVVGSLLTDIRAEGSGPLEVRDLLITKILDLEGDHFVLDERQRYKQPDWTYR